MTKDNGSDSEGLREELGGRMYDGRKCDIGLKEQRGTREAPQKMRPASGRVICESQRICLKADMEQRE